MVEIAEQARDASLAPCLLRFLKWDNERTLAEGGAATVSGENYSAIGGGASDNDSQKDRVAVRVYCVAVIKILLSGKHTSVATEAVIISDGFGPTWAAYKDQSLDLYVSQTERRRLLLGDEVTKFLEDRQ
jgi:hypothetical protein